MENKGKKLVLAIVVGLAVGAAVGVVLASFVIGILAAILLAAGMYAMNKLPGPKETRRPVDKQTQADRDIPPD